MFLFAFWSKPVLRYFSFRGVMIFGLAVSLLGSKPKESSIFYRGSIVLIVRCGKQFFLTGGEREDAAEDPRHAFTVWRCKGRLIVCKGQVVVSEISSELSLCLCIYTFYLHNRHLT